MHITYDEKTSKFVIHCGFHENFLIQNMPNRRFQRKTQTWAAPALSRNIQYLNEHLRHAMDDKAKQKADSVTETLNFKRIPFPDQYPFKTKPFQQQMEALDFFWNSRSYALFMEMGTGKTKIAIDLSAARFMSGDVNAWVIFCPNSIRNNWKHEIDTHCPLDIPVFILGDLTKPKMKKIEAAVVAEPRVVLVVGIESMQTKFRGGSAYTLLVNCMHRRNTIVTVDEAHYIKNPDANRSRNVQLIAESAKYCGIMTGTPIAQGVMDLYQQFQTLDPNIIGIGDYFSFRNRYAEMGGYEGKEIVGYKNLDELMELIKPYVFQRTKAEVLDLPPKAYSRRTLTMTDEQAKVYREINEELESILLDAGSNGKSILASTNHILAKYSLLQQITGGFINYDEITDDGKVRKSAVIIEPHKNPKIKELLNIAEEDKTKSMIIWAKFVNEKKTICEALRKRFGQDLVLEYKTGEDLTPFRTKRARFFVSSQNVGGVGLTLNEADLVVYFSNSLSYVDRVQSEDRCHRIGQTNKVLYIDLVCENTKDEKILEALSNKQDVADFVMNNMKGNTVDKPESPW